MTKNFTVGIVLLAMHVGSVSAQSRNPIVGKNYAESKEGKL